MAELPICSIDACHKPAKTRGWCATHYTRWIRHGDPSISKYRHPSSTEPLPTTKVCMGCGENLPVSVFRMETKRRAGSRCKKCHNAREREKVAGRSEEERERRRLYIRKYIAANRQKINKATQALRERNPQPYRDSVAKWRKANPEYTKRYSGTPYWRLRNAVARRLVLCIRRGTKGGRSTFDLLGYSYDQLRTHLERQFKPGMSWDNYGKYGWHIDHIIPVSSFYFETPDDPAFKACWALTNLRPLWAEQNHSKGARRLLLI